MILRFAAWARPGGVTLLSMFMLLAATPAAAQHLAFDSADTQETAVTHHVEALFDAMRASDADGVRRHFHPQTKSLYSLSTDADGSVRVTEGDIDGFAESVGRAEVGLLDEHLGPIEVFIDGPLATATMPYAFYLGDQFSHCGVNVFHLVLTDDGWRTLHITDTRRRSDCHHSIAPPDPAGG